MVVANNELQILWATASSKSVASGGNATSDAMSFSATAAEAVITMKAKNAGTPASGDTIEVYALLTCGDPDGAGADEYDTVGHAIHLATLDTNTDDPAIQSANLPVSKGVKIYVVSNAGSNSITVSACINEKTVS